MSFHASEWPCDARALLRSYGVASGHVGPKSFPPVPLPAAFVSVARQPPTETEVNMAIINLRDFYPFYTSDCFMEVSDEVAEVFKEFDRKEADYRLRT